ncbi:hypothetical protein BRADI_2g02839v3 [Brachypodium distachyon]|uniref:Replication protein A OB domain-containing protein n=1 Tax=Brachypodium distachyon TaxID=15368 RepID=A0A0Q3JVZ8_BRADI|nr:hypothetical protein BRADI_2g02839v3 [Brachypodium distachyon]
MIRFTPWTVVEQKADVSDDFPKHVYSLTPFSNLSTRVGSQECFIDVLAQVVGVSKVAYVRLSSNTSDTAKRVIALKDARNVEIKLVLWGERADEFDSQLVYDAGQESAVVGVLQQRGDFEWWLSLQVVSE